MRICSVFNQQRKNNEIIINVLTHLLMLQKRICMIENWIRFHFEKSENCWKILLNFSNVLTIKMLFFIIAYKRLIISKYSLWAESDEYFKIMFKVKIIVTKNENFSDNSCNVANFFFYYFVKFWCLMPKFQNLIMILIV